MCDNDGSRFDALHTANTEPHEPDTGSPDMIELSVLRTLEVEMALEQKARIKAEKMAAYLQEVLTQITDAQYDKISGGVEQLRVFTDQLQVTEARLVDCRTEKEALRGRANECEQLLAQVRKQNDELSNKMLVGQVQLNEKDEVISQLRAEQLEATRKEQNPLGLASRIMKDTRMISELTEENSALQKQLAESEKKNQEFALTMKSFANDMNAATEKMSELVKYNITLEERNKELEVRVVDLKKTRTLLGDERDSLVEQLGDSEKTCERMRPVVYKYAELEKKCARLEKIISDIEDSMGELIMTMSSKMAVNGMQQSLDVSALVNLGHHIRALKNGGPSTFVTRMESNAPGAVGPAAPDLDVRGHSDATARLLRIQVQQVQKKNESLSAALSAALTELAELRAQNDDSDSDSDSDSDDDLYNTDNNEKMSQSAFNNRLALAGGRVATLKEKLNVALEEKRSLVNQVQSNELAFRVSQKAQHEAIEVLRGECDQLREALAYSKASCATHIEFREKATFECDKLRADNERLVLKAKEHVEFEREMQVVASKWQARLEATVDASDRLARKDTLGAIKLYQDMLEHLERKGLKQQAMFVRAIFTPQDEQSEALWNEMREERVNVWVVDFTYQLEQGQTSTFTRVYGAKAEADAAMEKFSKHRSGVSQSMQMFTAMVGRPSEFVKEEQE